MPSLLLGLKGVEGKDVGSGQLGALLIKMDVLGGLRLDAAHHRWLRSILGVSWKD